MNLIVCLMIIGCGIVGTLDSIGTKKRDEVNHFTNSPSHSGIHLPFPIFRPVYNRFRAISGLSAIERALYRALILLELAKAFRMLRIANYNGINNMPVCAYAHMVIREFRIDLGRFRGEPVPGIDVDGFTQQVEVTVHNATAPAGKKVPAPVELTVAGMTTEWVLERKEQTTNEPSITQIAYLSKPLPNPHNRGSKYFGMFIFPVGVQKVIWRFLIPSGDSKLIWRFHLPTKSLWRTQCCFFNAS